jgi:hypothetical protein
VDRHADRLRRLVRSFGDLDRLRPPVRGRLRLIFWRCFATINRFFTVHIAILLALAGLLTHLWYPLLPWIFTLYICWSPWHYPGQNYGLLMMFARRAGLWPADAERQALHLSFIASFLLLMLSFHTRRSADSLILSLDLPAKFTLPARAMLVVFPGGQPMGARVVGAARIMESAAPQRDSGHHTILVVPATRAD